MNVDIRQLIEQIEWKRKSTLYRSRRQLSLSVYRDKRDGPFQQVLCAGMICLPIGGANLPV